jgi:hypothetical protein
MNIDGSEIYSVNQTASKENDNYENKKKVDENSKQIHEEQEEISKLQEDPSSEKPKSSYSGSEEGGPSDSEGEDSYYSESVNDDVVDHSLSLIGSDNIKVNLDCNDQQYYDRNNLNINENEQKIEELSTSKYLQTNFLLSQKKFTENFVLHETSSNIEIIKKNPNILTPGGKPAAKSISGEVKDDEEEDYTIKKNEIKKFSRKVATRDDILRGKAFKNKLTTIEEEEDPSKPKK